MESRRENVSPRLVLPRWTTFIVTWLLIDGAESFNYDSSSSCTRAFRSGRSHVPVSVPCDLNKQTYCNLPGATYPWHAVRRFVHENQGLMRRMYGDQRHISVLKAEIETNDIDSELQNPGRDESYGRNSKDRDIINTKLLYSKRPTSRTSESYTVPHFRPVQTTTASTKLKLVKEKEKHNTVQKKVDNITNLNNLSIFNESAEKFKEEFEKFKLASYKTSYLEDEIIVPDESSNNLENNKIEPEIISLQAAIKQTIESNSVYPNYGHIGKNISSTTSTSTSTENPPTTEIKSSPVDTTSEYVTSPETTVPQDYDTDITTGDTEEENGGWKPVTIDKMSTLPPTMLFSESIKTEKISIDRIDTNIGDNKKEQIAPTSSVPTTSIHQEGQLFQDVVQEEVKPIIKLRGVNACPVKEEVVAPFWANNTRGEVLALLNLYPFEQYVHWEKCTNEYKQMFCRDGCRCEQQYRLHRLLAYDPNNECRGIFSDWFRFPSCCVCKCYDMPLEFRVTSRSPRSIEPEIDEAIKKEMYQQAASDWYTINTDE